METTQVLVTQRIDDCCFSFLCVAVIKTLSNSNIGEERAYWAYTSGSHTAHY